MLASWGQAAMSTCPALRGTTATEAEVLGARERLEGRAASRESELPGHHHHRLMLPCLHHHRLMLPLVRLNSTSTGSGCDGSALEKIILEFNQLK